MDDRTRTRRFALTIVAIAAVLAVWSSLGDVPIVDEVPHIGAGYSYVQKLDYRLNPEHPPLVKDLAGITISFLPFTPGIFSAPMWTHEVNGQWEFGRTLIFHSGVSADTVTDLARLPVFAFYLVACWLVWRWSYERSGSTGSLLALTLFAFSPTIIAHARFVTTDMAAATGVLAALYCYVRYLRAPSRGNFWLAGVMLGLALLCKFSTALLGPFFLLIAVLWGLEGRWTSRAAWHNAGTILWRTVLVGLVALAVVWGVYLVQTWDYPRARQASDTRTIIGDPGHNPIKLVALWASDKPVVRAIGHWTLGLAMAEGRAVGGNTIYWMGRVVTTGGPLYFPIVYLLKEPLAWWGLVALAFASFIVHRKRQHGEPVNWWRANADEWMWALWLMLYWAVSIRSTLNIGVRHLLPTFPFAIMLVSGRISTALQWLREHDSAYRTGRRLRTRIAVGVIAVFVGWFVFESVRVFPSYLAYFNQLAGGPSGGYRYVVDSNLDWGQDLGRLATWVKDNRISHISLDYFGWSDPSYYLGNRYVWTTSNQWSSKQDFIANNRSNGWLAISATFLQNANGQHTVANQDLRTYRWLVDVPPVTVIGHSIFVWHITR